MRPPMAGRLALLFLTQLMLVVDTTHRQCRSSRHRRSGLSVVIAGGHSHVGAFLTTAVFPLVALALFTGGARRINPLAESQKGRS